METREEGSALPAAKAWAAIHTRARCEKVVVEHLRQRSVPVFLPLIRERRLYGGRTRVFELPLFPGYVFFDSEAVDRRDVFASRRVAGILVPDDPAQLESDLQNLASALHAGPRLDSRDLGPPGTPVQVVAGPLRGAVGELVRKGPRTRLVLKVRFLGFAAETTIDERLVRPLHS